MNNLFKVGIYLRLSSEDKDKINKDDDSESIKNQRNMLKEYIDKHSEFILIDEYCDEDLSGAGTYRPQFERLIKDCEKGKLDIVLCKSQSRFSRDMEIIEKYIHNKFKEWNIRFIGLSDNADTDNEGNKKARQINGLVNEWYLEDVSNNIRSAFNAKMKQGEFISPFAPYGYEIAKDNNNKLVIDPIASLIVKQIYHLYLNGLGYTSIAKYLNNKNISSPSVYKYHKGIKLNIVSNKKREEIKWNNNAIKTILTNEVYLGHLVQGKRTTISYKNHKIKKKEQSSWIRKENIHEAIIDEETFKKVKKIREKRIRPMVKSGLRHIFTNKVYCLECGQKMYKKNSSKYTYLICSSHKRKINNCSNNKAIRYDILENIILKELNKKINNYYDKKELEKLSLIKYNKIKDLEENILYIKKEILKINNYLKNLYEDKVNGIITNKQFNILLKEYNKEENIYNKQINNIKEKINNIKSNKEIFNKYNKLSKLNNVIIEEFIKKIEIGKIEKKKRDIIINWNI